MSDVPSSILQKWQKSVEKRIRRQAMSAPHGRKKEVQSSVSSAVGDAIDFEVFLKAAKSLDGSAVMEYAKRHPELLKHKHMHKVFACVWKMSPLDEVWVDWAFEKGMDIGKLASTSTSIFSKIFQAKRTDWLDRAWAQHGPKDQTRWCNLDKAISKAPNVWGAWFLDRHPGQLDVSLGHWTGLAHESIGVWHMLYVSPDEYVSPSIKTDILSRITKMSADEVLHVRASKNPESNHASIATSDSSEQLFSRYVLTQEWSRMMGQFRDYPIYVDKVEKWNDWLHHRQEFLDRVNAHLAPHPLDLCDAPAFEKDERRMYDYQHWFEYDWVQELPMLGWSMSHIIINQANHQCLNPSRVNLLPCLTIADGGCSKRKS